VRDFARRLDPDADAPEAIAEHEERFYAALADDFNTPAARAELFDWIAEANRRIDDGERVGPGPVAGMLHCLGLEDLLEPDEEAPDAEALQLLEQREAARAEQDFATADARRDQLAERGWEVRDTAEGPQLVRRR